MVRRLGFDLQPLGPALAVFPTVASRILNETGELPSWTSSLPQSRTVSPGSIRCRTVKVCDLARTPLLRFFAPSTFRARCRGPLAPRHRSAVSRSVAGLPTRFLPPSPFLTTSTVCLAPSLPEISSGDALGVPVLQGHSRLPATPSLPSSPPLLPFLPWTCLHRGSRLTSALRLQGFDRPSTVSAHLGFPVGEGPIPSWTFIGGTSRRLAVRRIPRCEDGRSVPSRFPIEKIGRAHV